MQDRIFFEKPDLNLLTKHFSCVDMHFHTKYSDTYTKVPNIIKKAAKKGVGVAITDHNGINGSIEAYNNKKGVMVVPAIEISAKQGPHILFYFYSMKELQEFYEKKIKDFKSRAPYMATKLTAEEILERAEGYNCISSAAHPSSIGHWDLRAKVEKGEISRDVLKKLDCFEMFNGMMSRKMNEESTRWGVDLGKGMTAGSDGHTLFCLGRTVCYSESEGVDGFLDAISKKKNYAIGKVAKIGSRALTYSKNFGKHSVYAGPAIVIHYNLYMKNNVDRMKGKIKEKRDVVANNIKENFSRMKGKV